MKRTERRRKYYALVDKLTREHPFFRRYEYTVDHIVPKSFGFKYDIPAELIASIENLQFLTLPENVAKGTRMTPQGILNLSLWGYEDMAYVEREKLKRTAPKL